MTDKENYDSALITSAEVGKFIALPRCIKCDQYQGNSSGGACIKHGDIPEEYLYTPNECQDYSEDIPF